MSTHKKQIVVVEDDNVLGRIYTEILQSAGHIVTWLHDGQVALDTIQSQTPPDLILLDLHLPTISGSQILSTLRQDDRFADVRIVIATADGFQAKELENLADLVLLKPISYEQLTHLCQQLFAEE
jgi:CheY-like chemotaxis protein